jgi:invasion protein IalB
MSGRRAAEHNGEMTSGFPFSIYIEFILKRIGENGDIVQPRQSLPRREGIVTTAPGTWIVACNIRQGIDDRERLCHLAKRQQKR